MVNSWEITLIFLDEKADDLTLLALNAELVIRVFANLESAAEFEESLENQLKDMVKRGKNLRVKLIEDIDEYDGDDPLFPWIKCVKWVQEAFPPGGECSRLLVIYEQCVRKFWHSDRYKDDLRYLKVWLEYVEHCADAEVIYKFLEVNDIGRTHGLYYRDYGLHMEFKGRAERNKENNALPGKWVAFKVPKKPIVRTAASSFEAFFDEEECTDEGVEKRKKIETISPSSSNVLPLTDGREIKKETELLRQNPLRHFPRNSFLR
ncbi:unnamed protein product [Brassica oleracea]